MTAKKTAKNAAKAKPSAKKVPKEKCEDRDCPVHGHLKVRGNIFRGTVVSDKMEKSVVVERKLLKFIPKYERHARTKSRIVAHVPPCMEVKAGDSVEIGETRKISKTKNFVVLKVEE